MQRHVLLVATALFSLLPLTAAPTLAVPLGMTKDGAQHSDLLVEKVARFARRGAVVGPRGGYAARRTGVAVGPRGGYAARRTSVAVGPRGGVAVRRTTVVRPGYGGGGVRWARPGRYWWRPGGAVVAGAAIGFVAATTAVAWAGAPPAPNMCWYYTDPGRTQGFWDVCP